MENQGKGVRMGETVDVPQEKLGEVLGVDNKREITQRYVQSIFNQWIGKREEALADLQIYMEHPVGVGEHSDIGEEVRKKIAEIDKYDSLVATMQKYFTGQNTNEAP